MENKERWLQLCERAAWEQDPEKAIELAKEVIRLLDEQETQGKANRTRNNPKLLANSG